MAAPLTISNGLKIGQDNAMQYWPILSVTPCGGGLFWHIAAHSRWMIRQLNIVNYGIVDGLNIHGTTLHQKRLARDRVRLTQRFLYAKELPKCLECGKLASQLAGAKLSYEYACQYHHSHLAG